MYNLIDNTADSTHTYPWYMYITIIIHVVQQWNIDIITE